MTPLEVATGWVGGMDPQIDHPPYSEQPPLNVLKDIIRPPLEQGPCFVAFSGGRDSSAVLAVAVEVAREDGLPPPVPVTQVFPSAPETDESEWQELVLRHLGLAHWERLFYAEDEVDLIGHAATESLRRIGLMWPATVHTKERVYGAGRGGTLLTGEGGDELFGIRRITPIAALLRRRASSRRRALRMAARGIAPRSVRRRLTAADVGARASVPWLTPMAQTELRDVVVSDALEEPLSWRRSIVSLLRRRGARTGAHNLATAAAAHNTTLIYPLLDPRFVHAWAESGGLLGYPGRSAATRALFGHLLPEAVITRQDKVNFDSVLFSRPFRRFVASWDGEGVDTTRVVRDELKRAWTTGQSHAGTALILQTAWLYAKGLPPSGATQESP